MIVAPVIVGIMGKLKQKSTKQKSMSKKRITIFTAPESHESIARAVAESLEDKLKRMIAKFI